MNLLQKVEQQLLKDAKVHPDFKAGDTIKVMVKVVEGTKERLQAYQGVCIARRGGGAGASFCVRKISSGESVERIFPLYSPIVSSIEVIKKGKVRRSKLYYLRSLFGKSARIEELNDRPSAS